MKKLLLLGAGGFIGKALCYELSKDYLIKAFDIIPDSKLQSLSAIEMVTGNFAALSDFTSIIKDIDIIIHLISTTVPIEDTSQITSELETNVLPTVRLLESLTKLSNPPEVIFISSGGTIYGHSNREPCCETDVLLPMCGYGMQKLTIENYITFYGRYYNLPYKIVRVANVYGLDVNYQKHQGIIPIYIRSLLQNNPITIYGDGDNTRDYIYISDLVNAIKRLLTYTGEHHIFNLGSGIGYTINEIIAMIEKETKKSFVKINFMASRKCDVAYNVLNITSARNELSWEPHYTLPVGIQTIYKSYTNLLT